MQTHSAPTQKPGASKEGSAGRRVAMPLAHTPSPGVLPRGDGAPLDGPTRSFMERRFRHDFGRVRIHTDTSAARSTERLDALAYTVRNDIVFAPGWFRPDTPAGRAVLAHELAHVVQQRHAPTPRDGRAQGRTPHPGPPHPGPPHAGGRIERASPAEEANAHELSHAVLTGKPTGTALDIREPRIARLERSAIYNPPSSSPHSASGPPIEVTQHVRPGQCRFRPEAHGSHQQGINVSRAFFEFSVCGGSTRFTSHSQLNYGQILAGVVQSVDAFLANPAAPGAADTLQRQLEALGPDVQQVLQLQVGQFVVQLTGQLDPLFNGTVRGGAAATVSIPIGNNRLDIGVQAAGASGQPTTYSASATFVFGGASAQPDCETCRCDRPSITYSCVTHPAPPTPTPTPTPAPVSIPIQFEYANITPTGQWHNRLDRIVSLIQQGYRVKNIIGNASPEGPEQRTRALRPAAPGEYQFVDNRRLSRDRADRARELIETAIQQRITSLSSLLRMRSQAAPVTNLRRGLDGAHVEGQGELFGTSSHGEVPRRQLFQHLIRELAPTASGQPDQLEQAGVIGGNLPADISAANQADFEVFMSGTQGRHHLTHAERLDVLYPLFRRALVELEPPPPPPPELQLDPRIAASVIGTGVTCPSGVDRLFPALTASELFTGDCSEGETRQ